MAPRDAEWRSVVPSSAPLRRHSMLARVQGGAWCHGNPDRPLHISPAQGGSQITCLMCGAIRACCGAIVVPIWRHGPHPVCRQPPPRTRGGRRSRRDEARELAERLTAPLESATRLDHAQRALRRDGRDHPRTRPGSVDVRLRGLRPRLRGDAAAPPTAPAEPRRARRPLAGAAAPPTATRAAPPASICACRPPQGPRRGGREPRGPVGQRVAGAGRVGRGRRRDAAAHDGEDPDRRAELHGLGALAAPAATITSPAPRPTSGDTHGPMRTGQPCLLSTLPNRSRPPRTWTPVPSSSPRATAPTPSSRCRPRPEARTWTCGPPSRPRSTYASGVLTVRTPKSVLDLLGRTGTVDVTVDLPTARAST